MRDFTLSLFQRLLNDLGHFGYKFTPFNGFLQDPTYENKTILLLRHDVDRDAERALRMAEMENRLGIKATYYFRAKPGFSVEVIAAIAALGHEIGYHYEDLSRSGGDMNMAIKSFRNNLEKLRTLAPVQTICMHGSPWSRYDNRDLWKKYSYRDFGITGEPYFDIDFSQVFYLTDTGRRWDGATVSIRDRVDAGGRQWPVYRSTPDIIRAVAEGRFPRKAMITVHPQRWHDCFLPWGIEYLAQNIKNVVKSFKVRT